MRLLPAILLMLFSCSAHAQKRLAMSEANSYTLTEADGFPSSNYMHWEYSPSGEVYAKDFFGSLHITGNNFIKYILSLKNLANNVGIILRPDNEVWLFDINKISVIKNDSLWKTVVFKEKNSFIIPAYKTHKVFVLQFTGKAIVLYEFKNYEWVAINKVMQPEDIEPKNTFALYYNKGNGEKIEIIVPTPGDQKKVYEMDIDHPQLTYITTISTLYYSHCYPTLYNSQHRLETTLIKTIEAIITSRTGNSSPLSPYIFNPNQVQMFSDTSFGINCGNNLYEYFTIDSTNFVQPASIIFETKEKLNAPRINPHYPYLTMLTGNKPMRIFPYIKKYPHIYNNDNANNIFTLVQDDEGRIWAGNYRNNLSIIDIANPKHPVIQLKKQPFAFMNAGLNYNGKIYLVGENMDGGILKYDLHGNSRRLQQSKATTGFYLYFAHRNRKVYFSSAAPGFPVFGFDAKELEKPSIQWERLDSSKGIASFGMASIIEDTTGRIWMGHPKKGFAVYDPALQKGITYNIDNNETPIGFISSVTDKKGTVWMGSDEHGLWYYSDYSKPATPKNIHNASHPLLNTVKRITSMVIYKSWLVMGCYNRICLLNLDSFYQKKKIIVRYLNPQEAAFTGFTEQNTMLVSKTDSSVWLSTSDMLYQWDIKTWLRLPQYKVQMTAFLLHDSIRTEMSTKKRLELPTNIHGFDIVFEYLSPDCLPRYTRTALTLQGDSVVFSEPGMQSSFIYKNLSSGVYSFCIEVFEQDGTTSAYHYKFIVTKYLWQKWWFWTLASLLFLLPFVLWLNARRKKALQEKKISQLNLTSMSSQFRPHFILNTLNTIGADLKDKPSAESIISLLGESINLIFNYAQQKKVTHRLKDEWTLVKNIIQIHRLIYLPKLNVKYTGKELLEIYKDTEVPLGILEIVVENALLHGLRNKQSLPYNLFISIIEDKDSLYFTIEDNGVGRKRSASMSSHTKHGTGTQNLYNIISILDRYNKNKIELKYVDVSESEDTGTIVKIKIPKIYHYEY